MIRLNPFAWPFRAQYALGAAICVLMLAYAYYEQFAMQVEPCPLCIFQRIAFIAMAIVFALGTLHGPGRTGRRVYAILVLLAGATGAGIALRHLWLQLHPVDPLLAGCGPGLAYLLDAFPIADVIKKAFTGSGDCGQINWKFLGLTMPAWTLIWYVILSVGAVIAGFRRRDDRPFAPPVRD